MGEVEKIVLFFFKAESVAILIYVAMVAYDFFKIDHIAPVVNVKKNSNTLYVLSILAILATFIYSWIV